MTSALAKLKITGLLCASGGKHGGARPSLAAADVFGKPIWIMSRAKRDALIHVAIDHGACPRAHWTIPYDAGVGKMHVRLRLRRGVLSAPKRDRRLCANVTPRARRDMLPLETQG